MYYIFQNMRIFAGAYIDAILVYTNTFEEQLQALRKVNDKLREWSFFAGPDKCTFAQPELEYCGFILGRHGIRPQSGKFSSIRHWPHPGSVTDVRTFLGLCGFYQGFLAYHARVAAPLTFLMHKGKDWAWLPKQQPHLETMKARLLQAPVLNHPDHIKPYMLRTDASRRFPSWKLKDYPDW